MILSFLPIIAGVFSIALGLLVLFNGAKEENSKWPFIIFAISVGFWAIFISIFLLTTNETIAYVAVVTYYIAALLIAPSFLLFSLYDTIKRVSRLVEISIFLPWMAMSAIVAIPGMLISNIEIDPDRFVTLAPSTYLVYAALFILYVLIAFVQIAVYSRGKRKRSHRKILAASMLVSLAGGAYFNLILPFFNNYNLIALGPLFAFIMVAAVFYMIFRHRFFDIRRAVIRTVTYTLSLATLAGIYLMIAFFVFETLLDEGTGRGAMILNISLTLVLAFIFQPVRRFFDKITNKIFYRDEYVAEEFYTRHNRALASTADLRRLLERSADEINDTIKTEQVFFFIQYDGDRFMSAGTEKYSRMARKDVEVLDEYIRITKNDFMVTDLLEDGETIKRLLTSYRIALLVPLIHDDEIIGYLCLGDKKTGVYTKRDIQTMLTITDGLIIAIQNALSVREIKELNETLQQRVTAATKELRLSNSQLIRLDEAKDEFVSMASHQLRTPLTSIKGYVSMLLEEDAGKINNMQKHFLREAFTSSERMVRLINDFLNVSRLQTGRFIIDKKPTDLAKVVKGELASLESSAASRNLEFIFKAPKNIPTLNLDEDKIRQVIMNFVDNAMFYSPEGSKINVRLSTVGDEVEFIVKDKGIGVPKSEQSRLFTKFYRASNARTQRPDGTGVGLFLAKKVISDHGGRVLFESTEGKGSTFGFKLPISRLLSRDDTNELDN